MGSVNLFPAIEAYYNEESLANILSLSSVSSFYQVMMDSQKKNCLTVHVSNDFVLNFQKCGVGLYRLDSTAPVEPKHVQLAQSPTAPLEAMPVEQCPRPSPNLKKIT